MEMPCIALPRRAGDPNWAHSRSRASQFVGSAPQNPTQHQFINHGWTGGQDKKKALDKLSPVTTLQRCKDDHVTMS